MNNWNLFFFFSCCAMQHAGSEFPDQGSNLGPLQWKPRVLATGPPGKSLESFRYMIEAGFTTPLTLTSHSANVTAVPRETGVSCGWIKKKKSSLFGKKKKVTGNIPLVGLLQHPSLEEVKSIPSDTGLPSGLSDALASYLQEGANNQ